MGKKLSQRSYRRAHALVDALIAKGYRAYMTSGLDGRVFSATMCVHGFAPGTDLTVMCVAHLRGDWSIWVTTMYVDGEYTRHGVVVKEYADDDTISARLCRALVKAGMEPCVVDYALMYAHGPDTSVEVAD